MKKLFCTVVTDLNGMMESPSIYHIRCKNKEEAEQLVHEELVEMGWDPEQVEDAFDIFTFELRDVDIIEI